MTTIELLKRATKLINKAVLCEEEKDELKNIICFLSELRKNNSNIIQAYPQMDFILYNASRKLRTFGYNRLNGFSCETMNKESAALRLKDNIIDEYYRSPSGFVLDKLVCMRCLVTNK